MSWLQALCPRALPPPPPGGPPPPGPITFLLGLGLLGACLGSLSSNLVTRLTSFALADLRGGIGFGVDESAWITATYQIAEVAVIPLTPWLAGIISLRRGIAIAVALQTLASAALPAAQHSYTAVIVLRFIEGVGGGALIPLLLATLLRFLPAHQRVWGFGVYALITAGTPQISESLSGVLTENFDWRAIFWAAIIPGIAVMFLVLVGLPVEKVKTEPLAKTDYVGMLLAVLLVSTLTAALDEGQRLDWFDSPLIIGLFVATALFFAAFLVRELTTPNPLIDLSLLLRGNFTGGLSTIFCFSFATLATSYVVPQYGAEVRSLREIQVGQDLIWLGALQPVMCIVAGFLLRAIDARVVLALGLFIGGIGCRLLTFIDSDWVRDDFLLPLVVQASSYPLIMVALITISTSTLQPKDAGPGGTLFNIMRTLAGTVGTTVAGAILTVRTRVHSAHILEHVVPGSYPLVEREAQGGLGPVLASAHRQATTMAVADLYGWIGVITLGGIAIVLLLAETRIPFPPRRTA